VAGEHLTHEEGITAGCLVQQARVAPAVAGQHLNCRQGQRRQAQTQHVMAGQFAERQAYRVAGRKLVVAVGDDKEGTGALHAPPDEAHEIERGGIGPVQVLEHHDADAAGPHEILEQRPKQVLACVLVTPQTLADTGGLGRDLVHRCQRARRRQRVAEAP
jgi:hypothetical protein